MVTARDEEARSGERRKESVCVRGLCWCIVLIHIGGETPKEGDARAAQSRNNHPPKKKKNLNDSERGANAGAKKGRGKEGAAG